MRLIKKQDEMISNFDLAEKLVIEKLQEKNKVEKRINKKLNYKDCSRYNNPVKIDRINNKLFIVDKDYDPYLESDY